MKKFIAALLASVFLAPGTALAEEARTVVRIRDFMKSEDLQGSFVRKSDLTLDLYGPEGELLETLQFVNAIRSTATPPGTLSIYLGKVYKVIVNDKLPEISQAGTIKAPPPSGPPEQLSRSEAVDLYEAVARREKAKGDEAGYQRALKSLEKARALPEDPR